MQSNRLLAAVLTVLLLAGVVAAIVLLNQDDLPPTVSSGPRIDPVEQEPTTTRRSTSTVPSTEVAPREVPAERAPEAATQPAAELPTAEAMVETDAPDKPLEVDLANLEAVEVLAFDYDAAATIAYSVVITGRVQDT